MATAKNKDLVTIELIAHGETSLITGGARMSKGDTVDVAKDVAKAAVDSGRWAYPKGSKPSKDEGGDNA